MKGFQWSPPRQGRQRIADRWLDRLLDRVHCTGRPTHCREGERKKREEVRQAKKEGCVFVETERRVGAPGFLREEQNVALIELDTELERKVAAGALPVRKSKLATPRQILGKSRNRKSGGFGNFHIDGFAVNRDFRFALSNNSMKRFGLHTQTRNSEGSDATIVADFCFGRYRDFGLRQAY